MQEPQHDRPDLSADEVLALKEFFVRYDPHREALSAALLKSCERIPELAPLLAGMTPAQIAEQGVLQRKLEKAALVDGDWRAYLQNGRAQGEQYAQAGVPFTAWFKLLSAFRTLVGQQLSGLAREDGRVFQRAMDGMNLFIDIGMANLGEAYLAAKERIIGRQATAIQELSTPVLAVRDRLLIIPLVGLVDTHRARQLTEAMLKAIRDRRARAVVMDITGVPLVDSKVANHFAQACEAARLMGASVILTGISAEIAQALVTIGAELEGVPTLNDLQSGIEEAERLLGYEVVRNGAAPHA